MYEPNWRYKGVHNFILLATRSKYIGYLIFEALLESSFDSLNAKTTYLFYTLLLHEGILFYFDNYDIMSRNSVTYDIHTGNIYEINMSDDL